VSQVIANETHTFNITMTKWEVYIYCMSPHKIIAHNNHHISRCHPQN